MATVLSSTVAAGPQRIASINLCTDQLLLLLADRQNIVSVSYFATQPHVSALAPLARGIPQNYGQAEEILTLKPDLVLASVFTTHSTNALLERLGIPVLEISVANGIEEIRRNIRKVAHAVGKPETGTALLKKFDHELAAASRPISPTAPVAALYRENNTLYGANTIAGAFTRAAGMENLADRLGREAFSDLPLEILIERQPDFVIEGTGAWHAQRGIRAYRSLHHPALDKLLEKRQLVRVPDRLWACGSPNVVDAVEILATAHQKWRTLKKPGTDGGSNP